MEIYHDDYGDILDYLESERWEGMEFVAYQMGTPVHKHELSSFIDHYEAQEFCHHKSTDHDLYACLSISSVYNTMQAGMRNKNLLIEKDGIVDVAAMVNLYYEKLTQQDIRATKLRESVINGEEKEKVGILQNQFGYVGIEGLKVEDILALVRSTEKNPVHEYSLYLDKEGNYVEKDHEYEHRLDLKLICRIDPERDKIYLDKYYCSVCLKDKDPVKLFQSVSYENTLKPLELFKMVKNGTAIERSFYDSQTGEFYKSFVHINPNQTDNEGNLQIVINQIDFHKLIRNSNIIDRDNIFTKLLIKSSFAKGELAKAKIDLNGETKEVLVKLMPLDNTLSYFDKENMKPISVSLKNDNSLQSREHEIGHTADSKQKKEKEQAERNNLKSEKKSLVNKPRRKI